MASFEDLQAIYRRLRENTFSVGLYFNDPDGNADEAYYSTAHHRWVKNIW
jgi:catechol-2,3-dioxygenase